MAAANLACFLHGKYDLRLQEVPIPEPGPGQVQLSARRVGICGTDTGYYKYFAVSGEELKHPWILGHEVSAVVTKLGPGVVDLKIGDRVAVEPLGSCGRCHCCKIGRYNECSTGLCRGCFGKDGFLTRFQVHEAHACFKLPDNLDMDEGALVEPLAVAVQACRRTGISLGHNVAINGTGPIAIACMLTAKAMGASSVCICDFSSKDTNRLEFAKQFGADHTLKAGGKTPREVAAEVCAIYGGEGSDVTLDTSAYESSLQASIFATRRTGVIGLLGLGQQPIPLPIHDAMYKELDIRGILCYSNCFPTAIQLLASGRVNMKQLITHRFNMVEIEEAYKTAIRGDGDVMKIILDCNT